MLPRIINLILGVWLMAAPAVLDYAGAARTNDRIVGPLAASCAMIAAWEITRALRAVNAILGIWLFVAPWVLSFRGVEIFNSTVAGLLLVFCAFTPGQVQHFFGGGWASLWKSTVPGAQHKDNQQRKTG
jgi:hypothetical protein